MVGLAKWKKRSQSLIECWISQLCLLLSPASCYTHCPHCTKSLSRRWYKDCFLTQVESPSEDIWKIQNCKRLPLVTQWDQGVECGLAETFEKIGLWDKHTVFCHYHIFLLYHQPLPWVTAGFSSELTTPVSESKGFRRKYEWFLLTETWVRSVHMRVFYWI